MDYYHKIFKIGCAEIQHMLPLTQIERKEGKMIQVIYIRPVKSKKGLTFNMCINTSRRRQGPSSDIIIFLGSLGNAKS